MAAVEASIVSFPTKPQKQALENVSARDKDTGDLLTLTLRTQVVRRQSVAPVRIVRSTTASVPIASLFPYLSAGRLAPRPAPSIDRAYGGDLQVLYAARGAPIVLLTENHILSPRVGFPRTKNVGGAYKNAVGCFDGKAGALGARGAHVDPLGPLCPYGKAGPVTSRRAPPVGKSIRSPSGLDSRGVACLVPGVRRRRWRAEKSRIPTFWLLS